MTMTIGSELGFQLKDFYVSLLTTDFTIRQILYIIHHILTIVFQISHLGNISVDIDGLGPLDWILEILVDFLDEFFRVKLTLLLIVN